MKTLSPKYVAICNRLGFRTDSRFVRVKPGGAIGFTAGKPDEIRALGRAVRREKMKMSRDLRALLANL